MKINISRDIWNAVKEYDKAVDGIRSAPLDKLTEYINETVSPAFDKCRELMCNEYAGLHNAPYWLNCLRERAADEYCKRARTDYFHVY